jgi:hypothetical protein
MKKLLFIAFFFLAISISNVSAQGKRSGGQEKFGKTLNLGAGLGYYGYFGNLAPALSANFEFDLVKNVTLAPFVAIWTYRSSDYYVYDPNRPVGYRYDYYHYTETVIPFGVKGSYYFDDLLNLPSQFDLYAAASAGFVIRARHWENGYNGGNAYGRDYSPLYVDVHAGGEYHFNKKIGFYADLSTGLSTIGLAFHLQ